ncbi:MAG: hypothetical protein KDJ52_00205 [Anaerolineae bacterium]|nr:hypothetical protein [Anaerolineae bacterium]
MSRLTKFLPIAKIDEEKRMVWGLASDETVDAEDEVTDYVATKAAVEEWREWANIREMHGASAVGVAQEIILDDETKSLWIGVKVVDDSAWQKVLDGVYKGFSIGGKALKKISEVIDGRLVRRIIKYILIEISLVDRPANPSARFSLIKREGGIPMGKETKDVPAQEEEQRAETVAKGEAAAEETAGDADETTRKMNGEEEGHQENNEEGAAEEEQEPEQKMTEETVKNIMLGMLKELGLVREEGDGFARSAEVEDLKKSLDGFQAKDEATESLEKMSGEVEKVGSNLQKMVGDMAKVASAVGEIEERLERIEQLPQGTGPVLRELSFGAVHDQTETVLKSLLADATDPQMREVIGQRLTELQIKKVHQKSS